MGDDETSYSYDGLRIRKWNKQYERYGEGWVAGDVIGTLIDFEKKEISFWRNDKPLGVAFRNIHVGPNMAYFPSISLALNEHVIFNFGAKKPFKVKQFQSYCSIQEPDCFIHNYYSTAYNLVETVKRYVVAYYEYENVSEDERIMVGSILWEYLIPMMNDPYIMEDLIV